MWPLAFLSMPLLCPCLRYSSHTLSPLTFARQAGTMVFVLFSLSEVSSHRLPFHMRLVPFDIEVSAPTGFSCFTHSIPHFLKSPWSVCIFSVSCQQKESSIRAGTLSVFFLHAPVPIQRAKSATQRVLYKY